MHIAPRKEVIVPIVGAHLKEIRVYLCAPPIGPATGVYAARIAAPLANKQVPENALGPPAG